MQNPESKSEDRKIDEWIKNKGITDDAQIEKEL